MLSNIVTDQDISKIVSSRWITGKLDQPHEPRDKLIGGPLGPVLWMDHEEHVREASAKIGSICVVVPGGLGCVDIHTFRAVQLHHGLSWDV